MRVFETVEIQFATLEKLIGTGMPAGVPAEKMIKPAGGIRTIAEMMVKFNAGTDEITGNMSPVTVGEVIITEKVSVNTGQAGMTTAGICALTMGFSAIKNDIIPVNLSPGGNTLPGIIALARKPDITGPGDGQKPIDVRLFQSV